MRDFLRLQLICPLCVRCGSLQTQPSFFCKNCEENFLCPRIIPQWRLLNLYWVQNLLQWQPQESDSLSEVVYLLKSRFSFGAWNYYAGFFKLSAVNSAVIVPVPGRNAYKSTFHTRHFAQALSRQKGLPWLNCLRNKGQNQSQKALDLKARSQAQFQFIEDFTLEINQYSQVILVDDIITSGHTLSACISALKPHLKRDQQIEIIALFSREKI